MELNSLAYNNLGRWSWRNHCWSHVVFPEEVQNIGIGSQVKLQITYAVRWCLKYVMAWDSISVGSTPTASQSPGTSVSSMWRLTTSSGLNAGHHTLCANLASASAIGFGNIGAFEGGRTVTDETRSSRYS